ncbi:MAG: hypothetical protein KC912_06490 [Proteobacteria bacterium]|nr:hypothetical protein [Pseudomonadota bacterium]
MSIARALILVATLATGCGDRCESLCGNVASAIDTCKETDPGWEAISWGDLGARSRSDFASECRRSWSQASGTLPTHELEEALDLCGISADDLETMSCDTLLTLYAPF